MIIIGAVFAYTLAFFCRPEIFLWPVFHDLHALIF